MKTIERVVLYECELTVEYEGTYTGGVTDPERVPMFVLEIQAEGVSGFGECIPVNVMYAPGRIDHPRYDERQALLELCAALLGKDPFGLGRLIPAKFRPHEYHYLVDAADFALHDLVGKKCGVPARALLGGIAKPFVWGMPVVYTADPEIMSAKAREWHRQYGFRYFKLKPNGNAEQDEETLRKIREKTAPDVSIFEDPNFALAMTPDEVVAYLNRLADSGLRMCEDPLDVGLDVYAGMRRRCRVPLMIDYRSKSEEDILRIVNAKAADAINIHADWAGGFQPGLRRANLAALGGMGVMIGSNLHLDIATAAYQILASIVPGDLPCEQLPLEVYGGTGIVKNTFEIREGKIFIPDRPGLGVAVDCERLAAATLRKTVVE